MYDLDGYIKLGILPYKVACMLVYEECPFYAKFKMPLVAADEAIPPLM